MPLKSTNQKNKMPISSSPRITKVKDISYFIFVDADAHKSLKGLPSAYELSIKRLDNRRWGLNDHTRNKKIIEKGDEVIIYTAGAREFSRLFIAKAKVEEKIVTPNRVEKQSVDGELVEYTGMPAEVLKLCKVELFKSKKPISKLKPFLNFIKDPDSKKWGAVLQGETLKISKKDYDFITLRHA